MKRILIKYSKVLNWDDNRGYGYLEHPYNSKPVFCHYTAIQGDGFKTLKQGQSVSFELIEGPKGAVAANVVKL